MPGTKYRTQRRKKRKAPFRKDGGRKTAVSTASASAASTAATTVSATSAESTATTTTATTTTSTTTTSTTPATPTATPTATTPATPTATPTATQKKLSKSPQARHLLDELDTSDRDTEAYEGKGTRMLEVEGLQSALSSVCCKECGTGSITFQENFQRQQGFYTAPSLICDTCAKVTPIPFAHVGTSKVLALNLKTVLASKLAGDSLSSLKIFCAMLDLPPPISKNTYTSHTKAVEAQSVSQAEASMSQARAEVRELYRATDVDICDILVSCDGTWQRRGFSSLFGAVFIIAYETGKVVDYIVLSKHCYGCKYWEDKDQSSSEYATWKETHSCDANFTGSAGAMEPQGTLKLFSRSLQYKIRYKHLVADGDSKTHALLLREQPYGFEPENQVRKLDCVGHVQKRLGTALRTLKQTYRGRKVADGKTIGGAGRLTDNLINSLQNYYGDAIRHNKGNLENMIKAVQATLLHCNSSDTTPRHHLCPEGKNSWCKWQVAKALGEPFQHQKPPIPEAIVQLLKPIYARLGSRVLLEKCMHGYTQNANESLHSTVWKFCPKELFLGKANIEIACALAVCNFNDGASSLIRVAERLELEPTPLCKDFLQAKDIKRIEKSKYKNSDRAKYLRRAARRKRKGFDDRHQQREGVMYSSGAFGDDVPGPSKRARN